MRKLLSIMSMLVLVLSVSFLAGCGGGGSGGDDGPGASGENTTALSGNYVNTIGSEDATVVYATASNNGGITFKIANQWGELISGTGTLLANGTITVLEGQGFNLKLGISGTGVISGTTMTLTFKSDDPTDTGTHTITLTKTASKISGVFRGTAGTGTATSGDANLAIGVDFNGVVTGNSYVKVAGDEDNDNTPIIGTVNLTTGVFTGHSGSTTLTGTIDPAIGTTFNGDWTDLPDFGKFTATKWE